MLPSPIEKPKSDPARLEDLQGLIDPKILVAILDPVELDAYAQIENSGDITRVTRGDYKAWGIINRLNESFKSDIGGVFPITELLRNQNISITAPLVLPAIAGDVNAQNEYERLRLVHFDLLPERFRRLVEATVKKESIKIKIELRKGISQKGGNTDVLESEWGYFHRTAITWLGFRYLTTSPAAIEALEIIQGWHGVEKSIWRKHNGKPIEQGRLSPCSTTMIGRIARNLWQRFVPVMLKAQLLEDFLNQERLSLPDKVFEMMVFLPKTTKTISAWVASKEFSNFRVLLEVLPFRAPSLATKDTVHIYRKAMKWPDVESYLDCYLQKLQPSSKAVPVTQAVAELSAELSPQPVSEDLSLNFKAGFIAGMQEALKSIAGIRADECQSLARSFFGLARRGACEYPEIISRLRNNEKPEHLIEEFRKVLARPTEDNGVGHEADKVNQNERVETSEKLKEGYEILELKNEGARDSIFNSWYKDLSHESQQLVDRRLEKVRNGNLGDVSKFLDNLFELRFASGKGLRIYFFFTKPDEILIVRGGDKSSQETDKKSLMTLIKKFRAGNI